jgi:hypothetical protein
MKSAPPPASEALILICEKCGKKLGADSREIQGRVKERIREEGLKGRVRAVVTTCMDVCPDGEIAVGIVRPGGPEFFTARVDELTPDALLARSKK